MSEKNWSKDQIDFFKSQYNVGPEEVEFHNSGICYSSIIVNSREAAERVSACTNGTVNGGWLHGMPLGGIREEKDGTFRILV